MDDDHFQPLTRPVSAESRQSKSVMSVAETNLELEKQQKLKLLTRYYCHSIRAEPEDAA